MKQEDVQRQLVKQPALLAVTIARIDYATGTRINDLAQVQDQIAVPVFARNENRTVKYTLNSAILPTPGHFVALLKHRNAFFRVSDAHRPQPADLLDIRRAEIFIFTKD